MKLGPVVGFHAMKERDGSYSLTFTGINSLGHVTAMRAQFEAAPELLAALKALVACPDYRGINTHEMRLAQAAIAKAEGKLAENPPRSEARKELLHDIFVTALEGGIGYWSVAKSYRWSKGAATIERKLEADLDNFKAVIVSSEGDWPGEKVIDAAVIARGMNKIMSGALSGNKTLTKKVWKSIEDPENADFDALDADAIVQIGLFGELVYG